MTIKPYLFVCGIFALSLAASKDVCAGSVRDIPSARGFTEFSSFRNDETKYQLITGPVIYQQADSQSFTRGYRARESLDVVGDHTRSIFDYPARASANGIARMIENRLRSEGFNVLYKCFGPECGEGFGWKRVLSKLTVGTDDTQAYIAGSRDRQAIHEYVAYYINEADDRPRVIADLVVQTVNMEDILRRNAQAVSNLLSSATLLGTVAFAPGEVQAELSDGLLHEIMRSSGKIIVVGYTDDTGDLLLNHELATKRAKFVQSYLHKELGVSLERVESNGVGPFLLPGHTVPVSRRVEIWGA